MHALPTGTVTFLFTDIEGSTRMWERDASAMQRALARHDEILRSAIEAHGGHVFKTVGDAFCAAFPTAPDALESALAVQRALLAEKSGGVEQLRVRIALHTGTAEERGGDYFGPTVNRVARLLSAGHGGQVLLSHATQELVRDSLPSDAELRYMGERRLKDLFRSEQVFQLAVPDLPSSFPPLKTLDARLNNLPVQPTPLVGREREVAEARELLRTADVRLLTFTGPGGTGKTRLSLQVAAELVDEYEGGVFFVALATTSDPDLVASAIAHPLGVTESGEHPLEEDLKAYLRGKELLLVLDNFEQVLEAASLVGDLLAACPRLNVLVTSRAMLHVYGEREYPVPPLGLPDPTRLPPIERLTQYEAVRLFIVRARAVKTDFQITNENAPAVAEICARLDGLPLAIELAAARSKILPPQAMLDRLDRRLKLLRGGARNLPARQQTLRGAIDWSYDLLDEDEQTLFRRLSVFVGGCTLEAVEAVCDAGGDLGLDPLDGIESLVYKSLIRQEGPEDEPRFAMLETIHEYAREKLAESEEEEDAKRAHAEYFLALAEEAEPELVGPDQVKWMDRLEEEHDNLRATFGRALERGEVELALQLGGALGDFWANRGYHREGARWLEAAISAGRDADPGLRARALFWLGAILHSGVDLGGSQVPLEESLALYRKLGDDRGTASVLSELGLVAINRGEVELAETLLEESLTLSGELGYGLARDQALMGLAVTALAQGDLDRAEALAEEGLASSRRRGDTNMVAFSLHNLGYNLAFHGKYERTAAISEEALDLFRRLGNRQGIAISLGNLAMAALGRNDPKEARRLAGESLTAMHELGDSASIAENLEILAGAAGAEGEDARAARLWGAAEILREASDFPVPPVERALREGYIAPSRSRLGEALWEQARAEGRTMTPEQAVTYALQETEDSSNRSGREEAS